MNVSTEENIDSSVQQNLQKARNDFQEQVSLLSKHAEKTLTEVESATRELKKQALDQAETAANAIINRAEKQAQEILEEKDLEARLMIDRAEKYVAEFLETKLAEARALLERGTETARAGVQEVGQLNISLASQLDSIMQKLKANQLDIERVISDLDVELLPVKIPIEKEIEADATPVNEHEPTQTRESLGSASATAAKEETPNRQDKRLKTALDKEVDIEVSPPISMPKVLEIKKSLEGMSEIGRTQMIPIADRPVIKVFLRKQLSLINVLKELPQVSHASEVRNKKGGCGKIRVMLWL